MGDASDAMPGALNWPLGKVRPGNSGFCWGAVRAGVMQGPGCLEGGKPGKPWATAGRTARPA